MTKVKPLFISLLAMLLIASLLIGACSSEEEEPAVTEEKPAITEDKPAVVTPDKPAELKSIRFGLPLDMSGPYVAQAGKMFIQIDDFFKYWNAEVGEGMGVKIDPTWIDTQLKPANAVAGYQKLKDEGVFIFYTTSTPEVMAVKEFTDKDQNLLCGTGTAGPLVWPPASYFVTTPNYADQFGGYINWLVEDWEAKGESGAPKLAFLVWDSAFGRACITAETEAYAKEMGVEVVAKEFIPLVPTDTSTQQLRIQRAGANYVYTHFLEAASTVVMKDAQRLGTYKDIQYGGCSYTWGNMMYEAAPEAAEGFVAPQYMVWWTDKDNEAVKAMYAMQKQNHPDQIWEHIYYIGLCSEFMAILEGIRLALEEVGYDNLDGPAAIRGCEQVKNYDWKGISGPVTWGPDRRQGLDKIRMIQLKDAVPVPITDWMAMPDLLPR